MGEKKEKILDLSGRLLARNALLNFIGQATPLVVGVITIPFIVRGLGTERFGLLSLAWVVLGYFSVFDLGLGRATTKFVAEALGKGEADQVPRLVWTAVTAQAVLGIASALVLTGITPLLVERILKVPSDLFGEAKTTFRLVALSIPVVLISGALRGVLEASQRFDLVNAVNTPTSVLTFILPLVGLLFGMSLPGIVALILLARIGALIAFVTLNLCIIPQLRKYSSSPSLFPRLFSFGGWVTVSSVVGPVLDYSDKFLIGSPLTVNAIAYYAAPYDAVTRLRILPASLVMTLFPAFSSIGTTRKKELEFFYNSAVKWLFLVLGPIILLMVFFARQLLKMWLGSDFAAQSTSVLQIIGIGVLINSLAHIPYALLQGIGRPDLTAKIHLFELPLYLIGVWFLVKSAGIVGAALAWTLRMTLEAVLLFSICSILKFVSIRSLVHNLWRGLAVFAELCTSFAVVFGAIKEPMTRIAISGLLVVLYAIVIWRYALNSGERSLLISIFARHGNLLTKKEAG